MLSPDTATWICPSQYAVWECQQIQFLTDVQNYLIGCIQPALFSEGTDPAVCVCVCSVKYISQSYRKRSINPSSFQLLKASWFSKPVSINKEYLLGLNKVTSTATCVFNEIYLPTEYVTRVWPINADYIFVGGLRLNIFKMLEFVIYSWHRNVLVNILPVFKQYRFFKRGCTKWTFVCVHMHTIFML